MKLLNNEVFLGIHFKAPVEKEGLPPMLEAKMTVKLPQDEAYSLMTDRVLNQWEHISANIYLEDGGVMPILIRAEHILDVWLEDEKQ
jgi:hypothetical protein